MAALEPVGSVDLQPGGPVALGQWTGSSAGRLHIFREEFHAPQASRSCHLTITRADISDGSLHANDIVQAAYNFNADIPDVPANQCIQANVTGVNARSDHLLLTPDDDTTLTGLIYSAKFNQVDEAIVIHACNPYNVTINESAFARFNLLVIEDGVSGFD